MISYKIIILLGLISSFVYSFEIKRDESIKFGHREFAADIVFTPRNQKSADARLYVNDKYARYDLNLWGEANLTEIIIRDNINPIKAKICGTSCDVSVLNYIPVFAVPESAEEVQTYKNCPFSNTKSCVLWKFSIDEDFNGYGYVSDGNILAIEIKDLDDELVTQTIFKDIDTVLPDSIFNIPNTCSCKGDVCFLIDGSESVLKTTFSSTKEKIAEILSAENDIKYDLKLSAVQFATRPQLIVSHTNDKDLFLSALANNTKLGGLTDIYAGLDECLKEIDDNSNNEKSIVIITDGSYSNHPQLKGDPRGLAESIIGKGIGIRVGGIESELFYNEELIRNISSSKKSIFHENESVKEVASKVLNPLCTSKVCKYLDCDIGYCGCGGCICPPGEEGEICRFNSPEHNGPNSPTFNGTDVVPTPESSSKAGAIVGGIIGALVGIAVICGIVFAIVRRSRKKAAEADVIGGEAMTGNEAINPVYEQQGVGGENPLYED